jgi:alkyldihydroxyacetonephosphate synthase
VRRWNGWADEHDELPPLADAAGRLLERIVGRAAGPPADASLADVVAALPPSRLPAERGLSLDPVDRVRHATGQSFPDWVALRSGRVVAPDAVARPGNGEEVRALLSLAAARGASVIPYGGGTSVVGGVTVPPADRPVLTLDLERLAGLRAFDEPSGLATFGAGTRGPELETALARHGLTLGHTPQSWERSTLGGWVAARGAGHQSIGSGRIEALYAGGVVETPAGTLRLPPHPASAAGPDLRQLILGSEGRFGVLTDVTVRASTAPEDEALRAWFVSDWARGVDLARELARARLPLAMIRLSTPLETATLLAIGGHPNAVRVLRLWLRVRRSGPEPALLLVASSGRLRIVRTALGEAGRIAGAHGAMRAPAAIGQRWAANRYAAASLRDVLWARGYGVDTVETAATWDRLPDLAAAIGRRIRQGLADRDERVHAFSHLSHVYGSGSSLYTTLVFRLGRDPDETLDRWRRLKAIASEAIVRHGATISHQHGVGRDHRSYLPAEKGALGLAALDAARRVLDPDGVMNPGVLLPDGAS